MNMETPIAKNIFFFPFFPLSNLAPQSRRCFRISSLIEDWIFLELAPACNASIVLPARNAIVAGGRAGPFLDIRFFKRLVNGIKRATPCQTETTKNGLNKPFFIKNPPLVFDYIISFSFLSASSPDLSSATHFAQIPCDSAPPTASFSPSSAPQ